MREERLVERIRSWEREPARRGRNDPQRILSSVLRHLRRILNTRRGSVQIADDYGVPDFTELMNSFPDSVRDGERAIRNTIQKYEPRLASVKVRFVPADEDLLTMRFQIMAKLVTPDEKMQVFFESQVKDDGSISVR